MSRRWREPLGAAAALAPALLLVAALFGSGLVYGVAQSLGYLPVIGQERIGLDAYRELLAGSGVAGREFWPALGFSLWVSAASTLLSAAGALLLALPASLRRSAADSAALNLSLAFPHLVWAVGLLLLLGQSGLLARLAAALGLIGGPADFPVLVRDRYGVGIILGYTAKETPFLALIVLAVLRSQPRGYALVAENLGASALQRLRYVTLPLVLPGLGAGALLVFAYVLGAYELPAVLGVRYPRVLAVLALEFFTDPDLRSRAEGMAISLVIAAIVAAAALAGRAVERWSGRAVER
jgi:putative spermidine/putrescine transport system permease protein